MVAKKNRPVRDGLKGLMYLCIQDPNIKGAEDAGTLRDWSLTASTMIENVGKRLEHNGRSVQIIGAGFKKISDDLNNQVADIDDEIKEELDKDDADWGRPVGTSWEHFQGSSEGPELKERRDLEIVYIIEGTDDGTKYYGPTDYSRACTLVNMIGGNVDVTRSVPTESEPIEELLAKQSRDIRRKAASNKDLLK